MAALITLNDLLNILHFALYNANNPLHCNKHLFVPPLRKKTFPSRRNYEEEFFSCERLYNLFLSERCCSMFYCPLTGMKGLRWERAQDFFLAGFLSKDPPGRRWFWSRCPSGSVPSGAAGRERGRGTRRAPWAVLLLPSPRHLARPPANFSERCPRRCTRSHRVPQRLSPGPPHLPAGPRYRVCVRRAPLPRSEQVLRSPGRQPGSDGSGSASPPEGQGAGAAARLGAVPPAHSKARGAETPGPRALLPLERRSPPVLPLLLPPLRSLVPLLLLLHAAAPPLARRRLCRSPAGAVKRLRRST